MKLSITAIFLFLTLTVNAQLAILKGSSAEINVLQKGALGSKIIGKIKQGDVFSISPFDEDLPGFTKVWFHYKPKNVKDFVVVDDVKEGFIPNHQVLLLNDLKQISPTTQTSRSLGVKNNTYQISIETKPFDKKHRVVQKDNGEILIDGRIPWGYLQKNDLTEIKSVKIILNKRTYFLPKEALQNFYQINLELTKVYVKTPNEIYINMSNADGSDSYEVVWQIVNAKLKRLTAMQVIP